MAHRAVLLAALSRGCCELSDMPDGEDVSRTLAAVQALGVVAERDGTIWRLHGVGLHGLRPARSALDCGNSGTTMRLLAGLLAVQPFPTELTGDASLRRRPMRRIAAPLRALGALFECRGLEDRPPLRIGGVSRILTAGTHRLDVDSAQVRSALLLAGLYLAGPTRIEPRGASRDHTERFLQALGLGLVHDAGGLTLYPSAGWSGFDVRVPGDISSAAFAIALAAATPGSRLRVSRVGLNPGRARYLEILRAAGGRIETHEHGTECGEPWGEVRVTGGALERIELAGADVVRCIDELPALFAAAAVAGGALRCRDAGELRVKESDRIAGLAEILTAFGARVVERRRSLDLRPGTQLRPARVGGRGDHRLCMAAAMLALGAPGESRVEDVSSVATSYPGFVADFSRLARPA